MLGHIASALGGNLTPARLAAAVQAALGQPVPGGLLTMDEAELIGADLFRDAYRAQVGPSLLRLDAYLADLARYAGPGAPQRARPCWYTCIALEPGGRSASAELLTALTVQWLTVQVAQSTATSPAVIIAGADEITRSHLEALADACDPEGRPADPAVPAPARRRDRAHRRRGDDRVHEDGQPPGGRAGGLLHRAASTRSPSPAGLPPAAASTAPAARPATPTVPRSPAATPATAAGAATG